MLTFEQWLVERGKRTALSGAPYPPGYATSGPAQLPPLALTPTSAMAPFALKKVYDKNGEVKTNPPHKSKENPNLPPK